METSKPTRRALLGTISGSIVLAGCVGGDDDSTSEDESDDGDTGANGDDSSNDDGMEDDSSDDGDQGTSQLTVQTGEHEEYGDILVGPDGLTLYMFDSDEQGAGESTCYDGCAENWPPLTVEEEPVAGDGVEADLTTIEREDGSTQVAANGWPLYYWVNDEEPGDTDGQAVNDVWWILDADGTPVRGESEDGEETNDGDEGSDGGSDDDPGGYP